MPLFITQEWGIYKFRLVPHDFTRNIIRELLGRHDVIPYFYGPLSFDLAVIIPRNQSKSLRNETIEYSWTFCTSKDDKVIKSGSGSMTLISTKPFRLRKLKTSEVAHYGFDLSREWFKYQKLRQIKAIDLGHISVLEQYKVVMQFADRTGNRSERSSMLDFTLQDRDIFSINIILLIVGAIAGATVAIIAGIIGYVLGVR